MAAITLVFCAIGAALTGLAVSWVSGCCGAEKEDGESSALLVGLVVGGFAAVAGVGLWRGAMPAWAILACSAVLPLACLGAVAGSMDLAALLPFTVAGWLALALVIRRPASAAWLGHDARSGPDGQST